MSSHFLNDMLFGSSSAAFDVVCEIDSLYGKCGYVTVADVCRLCNYPQHETSINEGWVDIDHIYTYRRNDDKEGCYRINFPEPTALDIVFLACEGNKNARVGDRVRVETENDEYIGTLAKLYLTSIDILTEQDFVKTIPKEAIEQAVLLETNATESPKEGDKIKEALSELTGGSPNDSLHNLAVQLLFGEKKELDFKYMDISELLVKPNYDGKMSPARFQELLDELDGNSLATLKEKNARYSSNGDSLHNFRSGAEIAGGTPAQACWGYMTKHLVALRDMVMKNDFSNREDFLEKCQDTINYIRFLWCIGNDKTNK